MRVPVILFASAMIFPGAGTSAADIYAKADKQEPIVPLSTSRVSAPSMRRGCCESNDGGARDRRAAAR